MLIVILIFSTILCHIIADFNLQGILAMMKQKEWWEENSPEPQYKKDYLVALFAHSFMWACIIMIPSLVICWNHITWFYVLWFVILNTIWHATIDDWKANKKCINLVEDQKFHMIQIGALLVAPIISILGG